MVLEYHHIFPQMEERALVITVTTPELRNLNVSQDLRTELLDAVERHDTGNVVLDLKEVTFIASVGFLSFLSLRRAPKVNRVVLCQLSERVRELFLLCKLASEHQANAPFGLADTIESALAQFELASE